MVKVRVPLSKLELDYVVDPVCFAGVNVIASLTGSEGYTLDGKESDKKKVDVFLNNMKFEDMIHTYAMHLCIYGRTYNEILELTDSDGIGNLSIIDPKSMGYKMKHGKNGEEVIDLDENGNPVGYVQTNGTGMNEGTAFTPDEILKMDLRRIADSLDGIGILEPIHRMTVIKMNIEEALGEALYKIGFPLFVQVCGDAEHEPSLNDIATVAAGMKNINHKTDIAIPYYRDLKVLAPDVSAIRMDLNYYIEQQIAALGIPKALIMGTGEGTNRATLEEMTDAGARHINAIHRVIANAFNNQIFKRMLEAGQISSVVTIKFNPIKVSEGFEKINTIIGAVAGGVMTPDAELEDYIREYLELPKRTGEFKPQSPSDQFVNDVGDAIGGRAKPY